MKTEKYQVRWYHQFVDESAPDKSAGHHRTYCVLLNKSGLFLSDGESICSPKDNFCKDTGRKLSLSRAMGNLPEDRMSKEERKEVWEAYRQMKPKGRW